MRRLVVLTVVVLLAANARAQQASPMKTPQRWYHVMTNLLKDDVVDKEIALAKRAAAAGYNGIAINDVKMIKYHVQPAKYAENLKRFRDACRELGIQFVVGVMPMGYAENILAHDPNLAEGMPVRGATFVVKDGKLVPDESDAPALANASFEEWEGDKPVAWQADVPGKITFRDAEVKSEGGSSARQQDVKANDEHARGRLYQRIKVKPYHYYHVTVMVKTEECMNKDMRIMGLATDGLVLNWQPPAIKETMDWTPIHATFNSLDHEDVTLYMGTWNGKTGRIWWDDVKIEPGGFVNVIRRDSLPLSVTSLDGQTTYEEGKDFSKVVDPKLVNDPNPGYFTIWHDAPTVTIPAGSRLKEGDKTLVSYSHATNCGKDFQIMCCMSEPKLYDVLEKQVRWIREQADPDAYFMAHDEIRHQGWDDACAKRNMTCGQILADNVKRCTEIIEKVDPGKPIVVWSDMFDSTHNAQKTTPDGGRFTMYLAKGDGPWFGSWEGLEARVGVVNWSGGKAESLKFFSEKGHQQVISGDTPERLAQWLKESGATPGVVGVMFTNWSSDYRKLEAYIEVVRKWEQESGGYKPLEK